jgi:hypothetical protein
LQFQRGSAATKKKSASGHAVKNAAVGEAEMPPEDDGPASGGDANVVALDRFRKKK